MKTSIEPGPPHSRRKARPARGRALLGLLAVTLGIGAAAACSSNDAQKNTASTTADAGDKGTGGGSAADSGNAAGSGNGADAGNAADSGESTAALCDTFFDALVKCPTAAADLEARGFLPSGLDKLPKTEIDRLRPLYRAHCTERAALPGSGFDSAQVSACLSAIQTEGCVVDPTTQAACKFKGTLPAGSACVGSEQCADGDCFSVASCGGSPGPGASSSCGVCRKAPAVGDACDPAQSCGPNAACVFDLSSKPAKGVCTATTTHGAGEACGTGGLVCADGLYCDLPSPFSTTATSTCKAVASAGEACSNPGACKQPLFCSLTAPGQPGKCQSSTPAAPGAAGATCNADSDCAADLGCMVTPSKGGAAPPTGGKCGAVTFAEPGAACDAATRCRVGSCSGTVTPGEDGGPPTFSDAGTCPKLIADGGACATDKPPLPGAITANGVCDTLSSCVNGKCTPAAYPTCDATTAAKAPLVCPDPLVVACPTATPTSGDACPNPTPATGQIVQFPNDCPYDAGKTHCGCGPSLNPTPTAALSWTCETCPATQPTAGDACGSGAPFFPIAPLQCAYTDVTCGCNFGPGGSSWACGSCPATAPKNGDDCTDLPQGMACDFGGTKCACNYGPPMPGGPPSGATWICQ